MNNENEQNVYENKEFVWKDELMEAQQESSEPQFTETFIKQQLKETKKKMIALIAVIIVFVAFGSIYLAYKAEYIFGGEPRDIMSAMPKNGSRSTEHVTMNINAVVANYAYTKHRINGIIPFGTDQHYIIWLEDGSVVSVKVKNKKTIRKLDAMIDATWDYIQGKTTTLPEPIKVQGQLSYIEYEIQNYYKKTLNDIGFTESGLPIHYIEVDLTETKGRAIFLTAFMYVMAGLCAWSLVKTIKERKKYK